MIKKFKTNTRKFISVFFHPAFIYLTITGNIILITTTLLVHFLEKDVNPGMSSYLNSLWWGVSTITTVGFGDVVPITTAGRFLGMFLMMSGTILFITFTGVLSSYWLKEQVEDEISPIQKEIKTGEKEQLLIEAMLLSIDNRLKKLEEQIKK